MAIKDLQPKQGNVDLELDIVEVAEPREFEKFGKAGRVATATVKDETGTMKMSLWNEQIDQVKPGDKIKVTNGYVNEYQGDLQLTTGKFGNFEVISSSEATPAAPEEDINVDEENIG